MVEQTIAPVKKTNGTLRRWEPFDMFAALQEDLERFWHRPFSLTWGPLPTLFQPPSTVGMTYAWRILKAELPGLKEDVQVEIYSGNLVIEGESKAAKEVKEEAYYRTERTFGSFYRSLPLPWQVTPEQIKATLNDGVLEVQILKPVAATPEAIKVPVA
jgi:HSP20 family protein